MYMKLQAAIIVGILSLSDFGVVNLLADPPPLFSGGDGSTIAAAVVIHATRDIDGTRAEYTWLRANHPGGRITNQSLISAGGQMYDSLDVTAADGTTHTYYFDITESFGKLD
jgi:hypothetical protein